MLRSAIPFARLFLAVSCMGPAKAEVLWSDPASRVIHMAPEGADILGGKVKRDDTASDVLYFKFHVDPLSDSANEPYYALFQLFENDTPRLGVGNALEAWGYSAAYTSETGPSNKVEVADAGEFNLRSAHPAAAGQGALFPYQLVKHNDEHTMVFKVQYVRGEDDLITVWLDPDLTHGATADNQQERLTTKFKANASFSQIRLRQGGGVDSQGNKVAGGNGWIFSDMAVATSFDDFVVVHFWQRWWFLALVALGLLAGVTATVQVVEKRKLQVQLQRAERQHALEQERARIAQDLHDELGSLLTRISLLGGLLHADRASPEQVETHAVKISQSADQTVRALEEIVWAVRPGSDTLQSLVEYIAHFASELFEGNLTRCRLDLPPEVPARVLPPDVRHNIFLIAKESLNNVLKHSGGRAVQLQVQTDGQNFRLVIADDGKGFEPGANADGGEHNGLENMRRRAAAVGGQLTVSSEPGKGARVEFSVTFPG